MGRTSSVVLRERRVHLWLVAILILNSWLFVLLLLIVVTHLLFINRLLGCQKFSNFLVSSIIVEESFISLSKGLLLESTVASLVLTTV